MKKIFLIGLLALSLIAATNNDDNKSGSSYGSAVSVDTGYVAWNGITYYDLWYRNAKTVAINLKSNIQAADTVAFCLMGSNFFPDSIRFYYEIVYDTLFTASMGDSAVQLNIPYGTVGLTAVLPRYVKLRLILRDGSSAATATIASGLYTE